MKRLACVLCTVAGLLAFDITSASAQPLPPGYARLLRPSAARMVHVPIGLCEDYPEETTTLAIIRSDMELLKRSGIDLLRISFGWDAIEAQKDVYDWLFWDEYVRIAVEEYGITLVPYVCYTPMWNSTGDTTNFWNHAPKDKAEFAQFMYDLVNRYKKWIRSWELWNEPDIDAYWNGTIEEYAAMAKLGSEAVRKADPQAIVVLGGLAHDVNWTRRLFRDLGISPFVDVVNIHNYFETWSGTPNEHVIDYVNAIADIVQTYGKGQSIWMAEIGYSTFRRGPYVSDSYRAYYDYEHTPAYQAVHLVRTLGMLLSTGKMAAITWYEIKDLTASENVIGDDNNRHLGVATLHHEAKPAEKALSFFNRLFSQPSRSIDHEIDVRRKAASESQVHAFEMADGSVILMAWLKTYVRGSRTGDASGQVKDLRQETITIEVPKALAGKAVRFDALGTESPATGITAGKTSTTVSGWILRGGDVSIITIHK